MGELEAMDELVEAARSVRLIGLGVYIFATFASAAAACKVANWVFKKKL